MANTSRTIKVVFDGTVEKLAAASAVAKRLIKSVDDQNSSFQKNLKKTEGFSSFATGFLRMGAVVGAGSAALTTSASLLLTVGHAVAVVTPGLLALPGIVLGGAAAFGVFKLATLGFSDALKGNAEALATLSPAARETVNAITGLKDQFTALKGAVQQEFFAGLGNEVKLLGSTYFPIFNRELPKVASGFNGIIAGAAQAARTPFFTSAVSTILDKTSGALANMKNSAGNALTGLVGLGTVGAQFLPRIGTAIDNVSQKFLNWVNTGLQTGHIKTLVDDAIAALKQLGGIAANVGGILHAIFSGLSLGGAGGSLQVIKETTQAVKDFLNTAQAQDALKALGQTITVLGGAFKDVLLTALQQLTPVIIAAAPFLQELARTIGSALVTALQAAGPLLLQIATFLSQNKDVAAPLAAIILGIGVAFKVFAVVAPIIATIAGAFSALGGIISSVVGFFAPVGEAIAAVIGVMGGFGGILATIGEAIGAVFGAIGAVISAPIALIVAAIALIGGALVLAYNKIQVFHDAVDTAFGNIKTVVLAVVGFFSDIPGSIGTAVGAIGDFFSSIPGLISSAFSGIGDFFSGIGDTIKSAWDSIVAFFSQSPAQIGFAIGAAIGTAINAILALLSTIGAAIGTALGTLVTTVGQFFVDAWNGAVAATQAGIVAVVSFFQQLPARAIAAAQALILGISTFFTNVWNTAKQLTTTGVAAVITFFQQLPGKAIAAVTSLISSVGTFFVNVWNSAKKAVSDGVTAVVNFFKELPGKAIAALGDLGNLLVSAGKALMDGLLKGIKSAYQAVYNFVAGIADGLKAIKGPLPKDKVLLVPAGIAIMQGLLNGLKSAHTDVLDWVSGVAGDIQGKLSADINPSLSFASGSIASLNGLVNHVVTAPTNQADTVASQVAAAVKAAMADQNFTISAQADEEGFLQFIKFIFEGQADETARRVRTGRGISFAS